MAMSGGSDDGQPMMDLNTTPLIDVMLVLLIMFIITIPIQTHAVKVDLPINDPNNQPPPIDPQKNKVTIDPAGHDRLERCAGRQGHSPAISGSDQGHQPGAELHFQPDPQARYARVDEVLAVIKRSGVTKLGFIGNEQYRNDF